MKQADSLMDFLKKRSPDMWVDCVKQLVRHKRTGDIIPASASVQIEGTSITVNKQFSYKFLKAVEGKL